MNAWGFHALSDHHVRDLHQMLRRHRDKWNHSLLYPKSERVGPFSGFLRQSAFPLREQAEEQGYLSTDKKPSKGQALLTWNEKVQHHVYISTFPDPPR